MLRFCPVELRRQLTDVTVGTLSSRTRYFSFRNTRSCHSVSRTFSTTAAAGDEAQAREQHRLSHDKIDQDVIPTVDLARPRAEVVETIRRAAEYGGPGFFYLVNHGVPQHVLDDCISVVHEFYALSSTAEKLKLACPREIQDASSETIVIQGGGKGYVAPGRDGSYSKDASDVRPDGEAESMKLNTRETFVYRYPNQHEPDFNLADGHNARLIQDQQYCIDYAAFRQQWEQTQQVGEKQSGDQLDISDAARFFFLKQQPWPQAPAELKHTVERYFTELRGVATQMYSLWEEVLQKPIPHDLGMTTFNLAHYPPEAPQTETQLKTEAESFGIADHSDWELFTLLYPAYLQPKHFLSVEAAAASTANIAPQSAVAYTGLEVWLPHTQAWEQVPHVPGTLIVNQGEMLSRLSGGKFASPVHRVRGANPYERYSLVSFWAPNYDVALPDPEHGAIPVGEHYLHRNGLLRDDNGKS